MANGCLFHKYLVISLVTRPISISVKCWKYHLKNNMCHSEIGVSSTKSAVVLGAPHGRDFCSDILGKHFHNDHVVYDVYYLS